MVVNLRLVIDDESAWTLSEKRRGRNRPDLSAFHHRACLRHRRNLRPTWRTSSLPFARNGGRKRNGSGSNPSSPIPPPLHRAPMTHNIASAQIRQLSSLSHQIVLLGDRSTLYKTSSLPRSRRSTSRRHREQTAVTLLSCRNSEIGNGSANARRHRSGQGPSRLSSCTSLQSRASVKAACRMVGTCLPHKSHTSACDPGNADEWPCSPRQLSLSVPTRSRR